MRAPFRRVAAFSVADLPREVERLERSLVNKFATDDARPAASLFEVTDISLGNTLAKFGQLVQVDPTAAALVVAIPRADDPLADSIRIANVGTSTNAITLLCPSPDITINRAATYVLTGANAALELYPDRVRKNWVVLGGAIATGGGGVSVTTPTTPTLNTTVQAITTLAKGSVLRVTTGLDLRVKLSGLLHVRLGRGGTTALSAAGIQVYVEPLVNAGARIQPMQLFPYVTLVTAAASTTCAASANTAGQKVLTVASTTGILAGDIICIQDNATPTTATEWHRVSIVTSSTVLGLCENLESAHANASHTVRNQADVQSIPLVGAQAYALVIDYGSQSAGDTLTVEAMIETWDSMTSS